MTHGSRNVLPLTLCAVLVAAALCGGFARAGIAAATVTEPASAPQINPVGRTLTGRLLDLRNGFAFFSNGAGYRLAPGLVVRDIDSHAAVTGDDVTGLYARAAFDAHGLIQKLEVTVRKLPLDDFNAVAQNAVALSTPYPNPDLNTGKIGYTGEPVLVAFTVTVPPETPLTDNVYISTDASHWDPMEIHMDRIDALHYRIQRRIASGSQVTYRYTRGSWQASERGRTGIEGPARTFVVQNLDIERRDDTVYHWSDESAEGTQPITPDSIPTPFNNNPFAQPSSRPLGT